jgi:ATP-binding cassette subfamily B protein
VKKTAVVATSMVEYSGSPRKPIPRTTVRRVATTFSSYPWQLVGIVVLVLASAGTGLLAPFYLRTLINDGLLQRDMSVVTYTTLMALIATLGSTALGLGYIYLSLTVGQQIMRDLRDRLYAHLQSMSLRFFTGTRTGEIQSRLVNDVGGVQNVLSDTVSNVLSNGATVLSTLVAMVYMDWRLTLLSVGILPIFAGIAARVGEYSRGLRGVSQQQLADLNATMQETLSVSGVLLTKTSGRRALAAAHFAQENDALTHSQIRLTLVMRAFFSLIGLTFSLTPVLVYWLAGWLVIERGDARLSLGTIVAFTALQARLFFPLTSLLNVQVEVASALALFDRIFEYLDMPREIEDAPNAVHLNPHQVRGEVVFEEVSFRYDAEQESATLQDISLHARPGAHIALVGPSGAGKTTLTYLIPRLYDASAGRLTIDGHDVKQIALDSLGQIVGVVTQESYLIHDTIRENLRYGRSDATDEELIEAAKAAAIHDHILTLPEGYDTVVGERGYKLSGGQKQRIAYRACHLERSADSHHGRSDQRARYTQRTTHSGRLSAPFQRSHNLRRGPPAFNRSERRSDSGYGKRTHRGAGHASELLALGGAYAHLYAAQFQGESDTKKEDDSTEVSTEL